MSLLYALEGIRCPFLDAVMGLITELGGETLYMAIAIITFWCVSKGLGYYILSVGFAGTVLNQFLKISFRIPRPWVLDPDFTIVESARGAATGYSFPSGHTQNAFASFGCLALWSKKWLWRGVFGLIILLIAFSRMYLGVHTPLDVGVSLIAGAALTLALRPLFSGIEERPRRMYAVLGVLLALTAAYIAYVELWPFPEGTDAANLASARENGWKLLGAGMGMLAGYALDRRYIRFDVKAPLAGQALKCALGLALVMAVRARLEAPVYALMGEGGAADALRYFAVVLFAAGVWPLSFRFFARMGRNRPKNGD